MLIGLFKRSVMMSTPLVFGAIAELIAERSGMMVTAIEGIFLVGAWAGFVGVYLTSSYSIGILSAIVCGMISALVYAYVCIYFKQNQIVVGTAINILLAGICTYMQRVFFGVPTTPLKIQTVLTVRIPILSEIPILGEIFFYQNILTYVAYILILIVYFILFKTSIGLVVRSAGENPEAVDVAGIDVRRVRLYSVILSGAISAIGGAFYSIAYLGMFTSNIIGGRGWIAFAICFLGNWKPKGIAVGALVFGIAEAFAIYMQSKGVGDYFPNELFIALPYILTIFLTIFRKNFNMPKKLGMVYVKEA